MVGQLPKAYHLFDPEKDNINMHAAIALTIHYPACITTIATNYLQLKIMRILLKNSSDRMWFYFQAIFFCIYNEETNPSNLWSI